MIRKQQVGLVDGKSIWAYEVPDCERYSNKDIEAVLLHGAKAENILVMLVNKWGFTPEFALKVLTNYVKSSKG